MNARNPIFSSLPCWLSTPCSGRGGDHSPDHGPGGSGAGADPLQAPDEPISNKRKATVRITATLRPHLEAAMQESISGFLIEWDGKPVQKVTTAFRRACERAGLKGVTPNTLRHTGATLLAAHGVPMRQIAGMLGHTSTVTTEKHYAKHRPEFLGEATTALDELFAAPAA